MDEINDEVTMQDDEVVSENMPSRKVTRTFEVIKFIWQWVYALRKVLLSIPVLYGIIRLSVYNSKHLGNSVGLFLQSDGAFLMNISKGMAVFAPLALTACCLAMMFMSRKSLYAWSISIFSLLLPVIILISNQFPA